MDIKKIREAVMASRGLPETVTDAQIRFIWNTFTSEMQTEYMDKINGGKNVASNDSRKVRGGTKRTPGDG